MEARATPADNDHHLVAKSLQGNEKAFRDLLARHHATVYSVVRGVLGNTDEVEDVVQNVYIKVYRGLNGFRGDAKFSTWVYQISRNEAINAVKRRRLETTPIEDVVIAAPEREGPEAAFRAQRLSADMEQAMAQLDESYRVVLELRYMGERSYEEIAETLALPIGTVKTYIHRGKAQLKKILDRTLGDGHAMES